MSKFTIFFMTTILFFALKNILYFACRLLQTNAFKCFFVYWCLTTSLGEGKIIIIIWN